MIFLIKNRLHAFFGSPSLPDWGRIYKEWAKWPVQVNDLSSKKKNLLFGYLVFVSRSLLYIVVCSVLILPVLFKFFFDFTGNRIPLILLHFLFSLVAISPYFFFQKLRFKLKNSLVLALFFSQLFVYPFVLHPISKALFETPEGLFFSPYFFSFSNYGRDVVCLKNGAKEDLYVLSFYSPDDVAEICSSPLQDDLRKIFPEGTKRENISIFMRKNGVRIHEAEYEKGDVSVEYDRYGFSFTHYSIVARYNRTSDELLFLEASAIAY